MTITLPRLGETMEEARVTEWLVGPGATFKRGDVLLEVETDKTVVEVPALMDGTLRRQLVISGEVVALDQPIAEVEIVGAADASPPIFKEPSRLHGPVASGGQPDNRGDPAPVPQEPREGSRATFLPGVLDQPGQGTALGATSFRPAASPAARAAARRTGVSLTDAIGSGRRGRITAQDVEARQPKGIALHAVGHAGPMIVLLHGLFDDHRGWRDLPKRLSGLGHRVLALDLPGHGDSTDTAEDLDQAVDLIARALPRGPLSLIGHSLGAAIATRLARQRGDDIRSLTLLAPAGLGTAINPDFIQRMLHATSPAALSQALGLLDGGPISGMALEQQLARLIAARPHQTALAHALALQGRQQIDITPDLARLRCPLRVVFGTKDRILDWQDVARLPARAAIHLIAGAGHLPHTSAPDLIAGFFAQEDSAHSISA